MKSTTIKIESQNKVNIDELLPVSNEKQKLKQCSKCGIEKELSEFRFRKDNNTYRNECKVCQKVYTENNKEKIKIYNNLYNKNNKEKIKIYNKVYKEKNKENEKLYNKLYNEKNKEKIKTQKTLYYEKNKEEIILQHTLYTKNRLKTDTSFKLKKLIRSRILTAIRNQSGKKAYKSMELLGCSIEEARTHLESQFKPGMSWDNHGLYGWHIDHIIPCAVFNLIDPVEQKQCFHYTNLQPLWAEENWSKNDRC